MNSTYGSSQSACWEHHTSYCVRCSSLSSCSLSMPLNARCAVSISRGLPAIDESELYGDPSSSCTGTSGSTCQTVQPASARKSTKS